MTNKKEAKVHELYNTLKEGVQHFYSSDTWKAILKFQARFHRYSWRNMVLIYLQCPHASYVAGFEDWKNMKRYVKRGERAIKILAPHFKKVMLENGDIEKKLSGFHQTSVFDVSQTGGEPLPEITKELTMDTETLREFYVTLKNVSPVPVDERVLEKNIKGFYSRETKSITVKKGMAALQKCKTLVHEMAHAILHQTTDKARELREVEAEGTAYVVLNYFGFDTSEYSFSYVAGWNGSLDAEHIASAGASIQKTAEILIDRIEQAMGEMQGAA